MAGNSSGWYKPSGGILKGQAVYISKAQRGPLTRGQVLARLNAEHRETLRIANEKRPRAAAGTVAAVWPRRGKDWKKMPPAEKAAWVQTAAARSPNRPNGALTQVELRGPHWFVTFRDPKAPRHPNGTPRYEDEFKVIDPWRSYPALERSRRRKLPPS